MWLMCAHVCVGVYVIRRCAFCMRVVEYVADNTSYELQASFSVQYVYKGNLLDNSNF